LKKTETKIYVLKWSEMRQTLRDDEDDGSSDEEDQDENYKDPVMRFETIPHRGCVNRIRSMHGSGLVATWSDENEVGIYDITSAYEALEQPATNK
jgi:ribosome assembly protein RRB1